MTEDDLSAVREHLDGATRALERGDPASASKELVQALRLSFAIVRHLQATDPDRYLPVWGEIANELAKLPPSLVREAMRIVEGQS